MRISMGDDHIWIEASNINPDLRINTDADIVEYNGRIYLSTPTGNSGNNEITKKKAFILAHAFMRLNN